MRYRVWWDDPDHINQLDELEDARAAYDKAASDVAERLDAICLGNIRRWDGPLLRSMSPYLALDDGFQWADGVDLHRLVVDETAPLPSPSVVFRDDLANNDIEASRDDRSNDDIQAVNLRKHIDSLDIPGSYGLKAIYYQGHMVKKCASRSQAQYPGHMLSR